MKVFEVKVSVTGGYKNKTKTYFVEAKSRNEINRVDGILKIWHRKDIQPSECSMEIIDGAICLKN